MPYTLTVTAKTGPGVQATATVISNVSAVNFLFDQGVVQITKNDAVMGPQTKEFSLTGVTTITTSPAASTMTIS